MLTTGVIYITIRRCKYVVLIKHLKVEITGSTWDIPLLQYTPVVTYKVPSDAPTIDITSYSPYHIQCVLGPDCITEWVVKVPAMCNQQSNTLNNTST